MSEHRLHLFNTLTRQNEPLTDTEGSSFKLYTCGPTVYNVAHIGNFRTFLFEDLLRRTLLLFGNSVEQVMNITDVDDKTIRGATEKKVPLSEYTAEYKRDFFEDLDTLRIQRAEHYPEATAHIQDMIEMISTLEKKGLAYLHSDGSVYFSISKFPSYGKLSHLNLEELRPTAQNFGDEYSHEGIADFALWKAYDKERDGDVFWESPWGKGRPGWHLECSVMAQKFLGETIDLHAGGVDLIFPHHENEIAQSEGSTGKPFARHWAHAEHLLVDHKKMSKKLGNFYTLRDLLEKEFSPCAIRYFLMSTHYRTQLNFTFEGLDSALKSIKRIRDFAERLDLAEPGETSTEFKTELEQYKDRFYTALSHDLNINEALSALFEFIRHTNALLDNNQLDSSQIELSKAFLNTVDSILDILKPEEESLPEQIQSLVEERSRARMEKNWAKSDEIRNQIQALGYNIEDLPTGQRLYKLSPKKT